MLTQVDRPDNEEAPEAEQLEPAETSPESGGGCLSWLFCCSAPSSAAPKPQELEPKNSPLTQVQKPAAVQKSTDVAIVIDAKKKDESARITNNEAGQVGQSADEDQEMVSSPQIQMMKQEMTWEDKYVNSRSDTEEDPEGYLGKNTSGKRKALVLDLDETLVHSSFKRNPGDPPPDFIVPVTIDNIVHKVYVLKRPYCNEFLREVAKYWEIIIFTASLSKYADPLLDMLDTDNTIAHRLFREHCVLHGGNYVKDLTKLGRKLKNQVIIDNAPKSYLFQPHNAVPITSWFDDMNDTELLDCIPVLTTTLLECDDVRDVLEGNNVTFQKLCSMAKQ